MIRTLDQQALYTFSCSCKYFDYAHYSNEPDFFNAMASYLNTKVGLRNIIMRLKRLYGQGIRLKQ